MERENINPDSVYERLPSFIEQLWSAVNDPEMEVTDCEVTFDDDKDVTRIEMEVMDGTVRFTIQQEWFHE